MMSQAKLTKKKCRPCPGETRPLDKDAAKSFLKEIPGWELNAEATQIARAFRMENFLDAVEFMREIAEAAETDNHHPDLHLTGYRNLVVELSTHKINGLSENDFILAAKINALWEERQDV